MTQELQHIARPLPRSQGNLQFLMVVGDPEIAQFVSTNGVSRLFVDLEYLGKHIRQKGLDTWKSGHTLDDVTRIRAAVPEGHLLVRINPLHEGTKSEIDDVIARGADSVMLPMFRTWEDLARVLEMMNGRAEFLPLVETSDALSAIPKIVERVPLTGLHIGLNDLYLDLGLRFIFQPLARGLLDEPAAVLREHGIPFGVGGLARAHEGFVSPDILLGEHVRLGSTAAILSRTFHRQAKNLGELQAETNFRAEVDALQNIYKRFRSASCDELEQNRLTTVDRINEVVRRIEEAQAK